MNVAAVAVAVAVTVTVVTGRSLSGRVKVAAHGRVKVAACRGA